MKDSTLYYSIGPLLYCPASHTGIGRSLIQERFGSHYSLAMCLEDTISDDHVEDAEKQLVSTVKMLFDAQKRQSFYMPRLFVRVRNPQQIHSLLTRMEESGRLVTGFIIPKFSPDNADCYMDAVRLAGQRSGRPVYLMPILEDPCLIDPRTRVELLFRLKERLDLMEKLVLNIRVGGNDLCHRFGFRRGRTESIHSIRAISDIFSDIVTVFGMDYVISGPVREYYSGTDWDTGLKKELQEDRLCGFVGKTVIHPNQIPVVNDCLRVSAADYQDARRILDWAPGSPCLVAASAEGTRMNEYNTHRRWAGRTLRLAQVYGGRDSAGPAGRQQPCRQS